MLRYHQDDPRSSMSGYEGSLMPAQQRALDQLTSAVEDLDLRMVSGDYGPECLGGDHAIEPQKLLLLRFLRGNSFSVQKALSQLKECVEYRVQHPADQLLSKSAREVLGCDPDQYFSLYSHWFMGFDRLGRPMIVQQFKNLRTWDAVKITTIERMAELHAREQELLLRTLRRRTLESSVAVQDGELAEGDAQQSHIIDSVVVVVDTAGMTLRHVTRDFVRLFKLRSFTDQLLFPEIMGKCIIVNTPGLFGYVWAMFSPMVDARTRAKISVIPRPADYEAALREIADPDQISPEYGGTGPAHADRPSIEDALLAAGSRGGETVVAGEAKGRSPDGRMGEPCRVDDGRSESDNLVGVNLDSVTGDSAVRHISPVQDGAPGIREAPMFSVSEQQQQQEGAPGEDRVDEACEDVRVSWFSGTWSAFGGLWGKAHDVKGEKNAAVDPTLNGSGSVVSLDEDEFFDALSELDELVVQRRDTQGEGGNEAKARSKGGQVALRFGTGPAGEKLVSPPLSDQRGIPRRRRGRVASTDEADIDVVESAARKHDSAADESRRTVERPGGGASRVICRGVISSLGIFGWCLKPPVRRLSRCDMEKLVRWLCVANAVSVLLTVASIVVGTFSVSTSWLGAVFGWQWTAVSSVCLGCLLLLLSLVGTAGARLGNRFTLLGFAALEGAVAVGTILMGAWCFALASGSATISDITWETISEEVRVWLGFEFGLGILV